MRVWSKLWGAGRTCAEHSESVSGGEREELSEPPSEDEILVAMGT